MSQCAATASDTASPPRSFVILQGMLNFFLAGVGAKLAAEGHSVRRINFNAGDSAFWRGGNATAYHGRPADWPAFFQAYLAKHAITDVVLFGDCRPLHRAAIECARSAGLTIHVFEEGYLRPGWVTYERSGVNGYSTLPRDPALILELDRTLPPPPPEVAYPSSFARRAVQDVVYHCIRVLGWPLYRHYVPHAPIGAFREYMDWLVLFCTRPAAQRRAVKVLEELDAPFFLFPMQLDSDSQIRVHSPFGCMAKAIDLVITSFAKDAPVETHLVIKRHPLDAGTINHARTIHETAAAHGVSDRVHYLDHPRLDQMLRAAVGVVTVNSTTGIRALQLGRPVVTLGDAIYDVPGMTARDGLARFWVEQPAPDAALVAAYRRVLMRLCLLSGDYFDPAGVAAAIEHAVAGILGNPVCRAASASVETTVGATRQRDVVARPAIVPSTASAAFRIA